MCLSVVMWGWGPDTAQGAAMPLAEQGGPLWWSGWPWAQSGTAERKRLLPPAARSLAPQEPALGSPT